MSFMYRMQSSKATCNVNILQEKKKKLQNINGAKVHFLILQITSSTVVCSKHFKKEDFKWTSVNKTLKKDAVPSVFDWSEQKTPRRLISRKVLAESTD